jgi:hypothetical protein
MPAAGVVTLLLVLVTVAVLAAALVRVAQLLKHVNVTLSSVIAGVQAIELATQPINPVLGDIANDLAATQQALDNLLASKAARGQKAPAGSTPAPVQNGEARNAPLLVSRLPRRKGA